MVENLEKAKEIAKQDILSREGDDGDNPPVIIDHATRNFEFGWLFFYNGKAFIENGDHDKAYIGNVPIFVDKENGETKPINPIFGDVNEQIERYCMEKGYLQPGGSKGSQEE